MTTETQTKLADLSEAVQRQLKRVQIFDNNGATVDRYTAVFKAMPERGGLFHARGMSENPFHPMGHGPATSAAPGRHLGKRIAFDDLPEPCKKLVLSDLPELQIYSVVFTDTFGGDANFSWAIRFCVKAENIKEATTSAKRHRYSSPLPRHAINFQDSDSKRIDIAGQCVCALIAWLDYYEYNEDYHGSIVDI